MIHQERDRRRDLYILAAAVGFPTLITWIYFIALDGSSPALQQGAYGIGKVLQFGFPAVFAWRTGRLLLNGPVFSHRGVIPGVLFGLVIAAAMLGLYFGVLRDSALMAEPTRAVQQKVRGMALDSPAAFIALGFFYSLVHSLLEEYYWRWFTFGVLCRDIHGPDGAARTPQFHLNAAIAISSLGFAAHHVLVLAKFFGWASPATYLLAAAITIGGGVWALLYERTRSLTAVWLSHLLVDAAIFGIGFTMLPGAGHS